ncbi:anti-sigma factor [Mycolicibacterium brisbanense]|uniref:Anti-sigma-K factor RskA n=1 Tax=Mycolicibacterium brisbanense TaxID=146020 RepID=A0A117I574_9MYCO|nr:anti-sigma factor [Mycolicibacterium brisbanense]MCV7160905.1 anti-sigma factor [Mycolicibacterium brisbanense]GAS88083.1 anti-sigma K factor [Mycolicibacterium brisbanense]
MADNHTDDELLDLAYPYALGAVSEDERAEIEHRLAAAGAPTADAFARIVADTQETMALVTAGDALAPPAHVRESLLHAIGQQPGRSAHDDLARHRARRRRLITRVLVAAAAVVVIAVGGTVALRSIHQAPTVPSVAQVLAYPDTRTTTAEVAGGTITLSASAQANAVVVAMSNVPPPPQGHVYQMWFIPASGPTRSAGTMSAETMPPPGGEVIPALNSATAVAVTVEPGTGSTQPTSSPVVTIPLT